ncbi:MAG TPA: cupredoxin domain-containing protein [Gaiellaceae bacterium]|nr:cupredoxin domain-containing protein [Gaiellaceae bacterium]
MLVALAGAGVLAGVFLPAGSASPTRAHATVTINVAASEWRFTLSKRTVPVGTTVIFKVTNKGKIGHDFQIAGKKTKLLNPGQSTTLTVKFLKKGKFPYICTVTGHARLGMQGVFGVGVTAPPTTTPTGTTTTTTGTVGNAQTTVTVNMVEYSFQLSQTTIPSGQVTFVIKNSGAEVHNFDLNGQHSGALLSPGATETWTVSLPAGQYLYTCDVPFHVDRGMTGVITVTP